MDDLKFQMLENRARLHIAQSALSYYLECFGDYLSKQQGYKDIDGIEAIHHYLVIKHDWLPSQVKDLSYTVIRELLNEELQPHKLSNEEITAFDFALKEQGKRK